MKQDVEILIAEDDDGHTSLITKNLTRAGLTNKCRLFRDGQEVIDFLETTARNLMLTSAKSYLLLLDIRMPKIDGVEVLRLVKSHAVLRKIPVIMITTTDDPREIQNCYSLGCSNYITKPIDFGKFNETMHALGQFLQVLEIPKIDHI